MTEFNNTLQENDSVEDMEALEKEIGVIEIRLSNYNEELQQHNQELLELTKEFDGLSVDSRFEYKTYSAFFKYNTNKLELGIKELNQKLSRVAEEILMMERSIEEKKKYLTELEEELGFVMTESQNDEAVQMDYTTETADLLLESTEGKQEWLCTPRKTPTINLSLNLDNVVMRF
ncbi:hypothetical protein Bandiella_00978 [Candidatus Bandiella woodruffii]|uniref:Chromosome partition protein Smc n=1 Tax=Candidatus Bandiella euplotis TaxID=1664265 RepID=A0ABZ0UL43_9RICK|nr:hypothetical protein Bandiella_00978 [Candidatus Bandiella woodruffii]